MKPRTTKKPVAKKAKPDLAPLRSAPSELVERFFAQVNKTETCWLWTGHRPGFGYGALHFQGRRQGAHRWSYEIHVGPIPPGMIILHACDIPACVNPRHLSVGTHQDNFDDRMAKGRGLLGVVRHPLPQTRPRLPPPPEPTTPLWAWDATRRREAERRSHRRRMREAARAAKKPPIA